MCLREPVIASVAFVLHQRVRAGLSAPLRCTGAVENLPELALVGKGNA